MFQLFCPYGHKNLKKSPSKLTWYFRYNCRNFSNAKDYHMDYMLIWFFKMTTLSTKRIIRFRIREKRHEHVIIIILAFLKIIIYFRYTCGSSTSHRQWHRSQRQIEILNLQWYRHGQFDGNFWNWFIFRMDTPKERSNQGAWKSSLSVFRQSPR